MFSTFICRCNNNPANVLVTNFVEIDKMLLKFMLVQGNLLKNKVIMQIFLRFEIYINYNTHNSLIFGIKVYIEQ